MTFLPSTAYRHVHLDVLESDNLEDMRREAAAMGLLPTPFSGHPPGRQHFEPTGCHFTAHFSKDAVRDAAALWVRVNSFVDDWGARHADARLYAEYETISRRDVVSVSSEIQAKPLKGFALTFDSIGSLPKYEIHIRLDMGRTSYFVSDYLMDAGFFPAYVTEGDTKYLVLTCHGIDKQLLESVYDTAHAWLLAQSIVSADLKFEVKTLHVYNVSLADLAPGVCGIIG